MSWTPNGTCHRGGVGKEEEEKRQGKDGSPKKNGQSMSLVKNVNMYSERNFKQYKQPEMISPG